MDNFLKDNHDKTYQVETRKTKPKKNNRFAVAAMSCVLVMVLGISMGAGGTFLFTQILDTEIISVPVNRERGNVPQISEGTSLATNNPPGFDDEIFLVSDTLVINTNQTHLSPAELYARVKCGVVGIEITRRTSGNRFFSSTEDTQFVGSGFVFTTDGYVLTNYHVIEDATNVYVVVDDYNDPDENHRFEAIIIGSDRSTDLAVLKIERDDGFRAVPIGDSASLTIGSFVSPIGFPLGLQKSMTHGIVSGLNREFDDGGYELSSIQFDAAVNSGNSGGPLFDMYGNVVGIVNKKLVFGNLVDNIGLAITIDEAKPIINDLLLHGAVMSRPVLGIMQVTITEQNAALYGLPPIEGIFVQKIEREAPAFYSDLTIGDIIVEVNGIPIATVTDVQGIIRDKRPGDTIKLTVVRFNETGTQRRVEVEIELANQAELSR
jgi:serine protease Do